MLPYYALLLTWTVGSIQHTSDKRIKISDVLFFFSAFVTIIFMGLRYEVGGDWATYLDMYNRLSFTPLSFAMSDTDPLYGAISWISNQLEYGIYAVNTVCAFVFIYGISALAKQQQNPWLAMATATPYLIIVVGMGYTRQAAAIGVICWTLANASPERMGRIITGVVVATLFHKTAILFLPIFLAPVLFKRPIYAVLGSIIAIAIGMVALGGSSDKFITQYVNSTLQSSGAAIRVSMNLLAAIIFILLQKKYDMSPYIRKIWSMCSYLSAVSVIGLLTTSSSIGVDRLALFLIPLQVVAFSGLPYVLSKSNKPAPAVLISIVIYNFIVLFVYLNFAQFSWAWIPYQNALTADLTMHRL